MLYTLDGMIMWKVKGKKSRKLRKANMTLVSQVVINNFTAAHMPQDATKYRVLKAFFFARNAWAPYAPACIYWEVQFYAAKGTDNATGL